MRADAVALVVFLGVLCRHCDGVRAQVTVVREPVFTLDARAIVGANRVIARTRFHRQGSSVLPHELAVIAARRGAVAVATYEHFLADRLRAFRRHAAQLGVRDDDVGDARALFVQAAFKVRGAQGFADPAAALQAPGLWGEGAIAGMARASSSFARLQFTLRLKYVMGSNRRFAALSDAGKQRLYDFYALAAQLLLDAAAAAARTGDAHEIRYVRRQAEQQLHADLGVDPSRVRFTPFGIEIDPAGGRGGSAARRV
jgi:hypothetical protein